MKKLKTIVVPVIAAGLVLSLLAGCGNKTEEPTPVDPAPAPAESKTEAALTDEEIAAAVAALIDDIYVQKRTENTDEQCAAAKAAWDALTDAQKELVEGIDASPDYFGLDTGDASKDDPLNGDEIGKKELLVVSFGTSYNDSRVEDIKGIEDALKTAFPEWSVRRAFTAQIIINHIQARDGIKIDNMDQALDRAVANGVETLVIQPTHLMHGAEYDELMDAVENYKDKIATIVVAEPLLGPVGQSASDINEDKTNVSRIVVEQTAVDAGYASPAEAAADGVAFVFMGHGTSHNAKISYTQMQTVMDNLGYTNAFVGTVEGEPEETSCEAVIEAVKAAGYKKVILRPLMVVAGDHANNDMAGAEEDSWLSMFEATGDFESVEPQITGMGSVSAIQDIYIAHAKAAIESLN
ncbi:MAG: sirohydrochlorin cobaltochelatase [Parasporobacterium sp.]|nr:sirohydrochlorin cobaltochelatase [Parasporobacterium sp.]